jgi:hypothetical protein
MPVARTCRACGAPLPPDLRWCERCFAPVTLYSPRERLHEPGTFVGSPIHDVRTSRWRAGPTSFGPVGRIAWTVGLLLFFPWWALVVPLSAIWRKERVAPDAPPTVLDRFRERYPALGREVRVGPTARFVVLLIVAGVAVGILLSKDGVDRYLFAAPILVAGLTLALARWNER